MFKIAKMLMLRVLKMYLNSLLWNNTYVHCEDLSL